MKQINKLKIWLESLKNHRKNSKALKKFKPQKRIEFLEIHLAEHCNLNCFSCSHFSQLAEPELAQIDTFESDLKRLAELSDGDVGCIRLMGGEPLLNPKCAEFFKIARKYFSKSDIILVTNGILLENQKEEFWQTCKDEKIRICPTKYPIKINWDVISKKCQDYGISLNFYNNAKVEKTSFQMLLNKDGTEDLFTSFSNCYEANNCVRLHKGKISTCSAVMSIEHLNKKFNLNFPVSDDNYIDIYKAKNYEEILIFLAHPIPFCKYCKTKNWTSIGEYRRSKKTADEYLVPVK